MTGLVSNAVMDLLGSETSLFIGKLKLQNQLPNFFLILRAEINSHIEHLLENSDICKAHPNLEGCESYWPEFWEGFGPFIWRGKQ